MTDQIVDQSSDYREEISGPSDLVNEVIPSWIWERFTLVRDGLVVPTGPTSRFPNFIARADESEERMGFGQDILQNLQKYRNFDTYSKTLVQYNYPIINGEVGEGGLLFLPLNDESPQNIITSMPVGDARTIIAGVQIEKKIKFSINR